MDNDSIVDWINELEQASDLASPSSLCKPAAPRKRKIISSYNPASPPFSYIEGDEDINMTSTPQKRRRLQGHGELFDPDATPRRGSLSFPNSAASEASSISRQSSAKGQIMSLQLSDTGIEYPSLNETSVPAVAKPLFLTMTEIERGFDIMPDTLKETIMNNQGLTEDSLKQSQWKYSFRSDKEPDNLPGRIPSIAEITNILAKAIECRDSKHEEASWNAMVQIRLLRSIFEDDLGRQYGDFNAMICTTARPHREFKPILSSAKMIDICVYATLDQNPELLTAIKAFSSTTPTQSVNHTNYFAIQFRPLLLSIETKQPGEGWDKAQLQMGVWHAAQWAFLRWGVKQKLLQQRRAQGLDAPTDEILKAETVKALSKLGFIPGVFVHGNQWHLVLSTYEDGKTKFFAEWMFGETKSLIKIYAVIAGVRELTAWGRDTYLPWFRENILSAGLS